MVDRVKPWFMVYGSWFRVMFMVPFMVLPLTDHLSHSGSLNVPITMFFLNTVNYPVFFPRLSTLTWDTVLTPRGTWGFYLDHINHLTPLKSCGWWWWGGLRF